MQRLDARELWEYTLTQVELSISPANFNTWFRDSSIVKIEDGIVYIGVPSQFFRDWYLKKFNMLLLKIIRGVSHEYRNIEYMIVKDDRRRPKEVRRQPQATVEMPLDEFYINKSDGLNPRYTFETFVVGSFNELAHTAAQASCTTRSSSTGTPEEGRPTSSRLSATSSRSSTQAAKSST
jgi:chromosomal replication initiator protein